MLIASNHCPLARLLGALAAERLEGEDISSILKTCRCFFHFSGLSFFFHLFHDLFFHHSLFHSFFRLLKCSFILFFFFVLFCFLLCSLFILFLISASSLGFCSCCCASGPLQLSVCVPKSILSQPILAVCISLHGLVHTKTVFIIPWCLGNSMGSKVGPSLNWIFP